MFWQFLWPILFGDGSIGDSFALAFDRFGVIVASDGTRDQMYLALRLAAIEHHIETVAPCPVIFR